MHLDVQQSARHSKSSFDAQFRRGRCPEYFYQLGDECVYLGTDGRRYSWRQAQRVCARRVARSLQRQTSLSGQPFTKPTRGVRQLILNTPEKKKILEALYREYEELNVAVRLPSDFQTLNRCNDGKEDHWPSYCTTSEYPNATCFETGELGSSNICLRSIDCVQRSSRLACEFTLSGLLFLRGCKSFVELILFFIKRKSRIDDVKISSLSEIAWPSTSTASVDMAVSGRWWNALPSSSSWWRPKIHPWFKKWDS